MPPVQRTAEVFSYTLKSVEYSISPHGGLRKMFRLALYLTIIAAAIFPLIYIGAGIAALLAQIVSNLLSAALGILVLIFLFSIFKPRPSNRYR